MHDLITTIVTMASGNGPAEFMIVLTSLVGALAVLIVSLAGLLRAVAAIFKATPFGQDDLAIPTLHRWADALDRAADYLRPLLPQKPRARR